MADMDEKERSRERERTRRDRPSRFSEASRDRSSDRGKDRGGMKSSNCRVYVSNIPYEYRWQDLKDLFRSQVGEVSFVELFVDENDKPRGCGIVEFSDPLSVKKCLEVMHRFELKGRKIVIKEDFGNARDKFGNLIGAGQKRNRDRDDSRDMRYRDDRRGGFDMGMGMGHRSDELKWGNTYGLSPQFLESLGINSPLTNRVFVANLEYTMEKKKLKEVFRLAGKVLWIDMPLDKEGRCRGFAVVEYDHPVESVQAISMFHNQQLFERPMTVRMDRIPDREKLPDGLKSIGMGLGVNGEPLKDVAHNLPSLSSNSNQSLGNSGPGILGAVPSLMGINNSGTSLSNLNSVASALGNLGTTSAAVLQAANLANLPGNLLSGGLSGGDLTSLAAANLVNNPLVQSQSLSSLSSNLNQAQSNFNRNDSFMNQNQFQGSGGGGGGGNNAPSGGNFGRNFNSSFDGQKGSNFGGNFGGGGGGGDRDSRPVNSFNTNSTTNQLTRATVGGGGSNKNFSNKIMISNLPPTASYQMLREKCLEFGDVQRVDDKGNGSVLVLFANEWEAERAIKNMDRARIDGRTIDVRFYY